MVAIAENRKFDQKKNHLKSSPLKLTWPIGSILWWNGPCVALFQNHIRCPIGPVVSEENIKIQKVNDGRTTDAQW
jgi:hypothetical protein